MKTHIRNKPFNLGVTLGLLLFITLNYFSYLHNVCSSNVDDCGWEFGFPVYFYREGGFVGFKEIIWVGLIINILVSKTN